MNDRTMKYEYEVVDTVCNAMMFGSFAVIAVLVAQALFG